MSPGTNPHPAMGPGICVIMAGGRGTRFWPLSRRARPKQLLALASQRSLLRDTYLRVAPLVGTDRIFVVTGADLAPAVAADLPELPAGHIVGEPVGRNTAPCAVLGMGLAARLDPTAPVALLPADHHIPEDGIFRRQLDRAFGLAVGGVDVVTLGIRPTRPETGYGYIEAREPETPGGPWLGEGFVEKPDSATAAAYLAGGRHFWNSGIFIWNPDRFSALARAHLPEVVGLMEPVIRAQGTERFGQALDAAYRECPAESIDVAVMEKLTGFGLLPAEFAWSDLGSWDAWGELAPQLEQGNRGQGRLLPVDSRGNVVMGRDRLIALVGVEDLIIVDTADALLVGNKNAAQRIKDVIARLEQDGPAGLL